MNKRNILAISLLVMLALAVSVSAESTPVNTLSNNVNAVNPYKIYNQIVTK